MPSLKLDEYNKRTFLFKMHAIHYLFIFWSIMYIYIGSSPILL